MRGDFQRARPAIHSARALAGICSWNGNVVLIDRVNLSVPGIEIRKL
jgi:hypothetical protein